MGTTMHAHIEVKKDNKWLHYGCPNIPQDHLVFACVNGMHKSEFEWNSGFHAKIEPVSHIHRIPNDISEITRECLNFDASQYKLKGMGVLMSDDILALQKLLWQLKGVHNPEYDLEEAIFKCYINHGSISAHYGFEDSRVVYWFDN